MSTSRYFLLSFVFWTLSFIGVVYLINGINRMFESPRVVRILSWGNVFDPTYVRSFEIASGIKVELTYYTSSEELFLMLQKTHGFGYDVIVCSDYLLGRLLTNNFLKPINYEKIDFVSTINPLLLDHYFDPHNVYSLPFCWELYGIGLDKEQYSNALRGKMATWESIFSVASSDDKIVMTNDPLEAVAVAAQYLFGSMQRSLNAEEANLVLQLLKKQRRCVEAYTSVRAGYFLATQSVHRAFMTSSSLFSSRKYNSNLEFVAPKDNAFIVIENIALVRFTNRDDLVYQFLSFIFSQQAARHHLMTYYNFPAVMIPTSLLEDVAKDVVDLLHLDKKSFNTLHFIRRILPDDELRFLWLSVKS